ncbi:MAG TPA: helix-turn-helix transcriptional regulator [Tissierellaceae bacterium]|nr:helix-turn-helix transcriptional regulator [Tissierellaceae bacterium]
MKIDKGFIGGGTDLLLLSLINERDMYGYEIIRELEIRSDDIFRFKEGTLYPILHKLENHGYLKSYKAKGDAGRQRKYYKITSRGKGQLVKEKQQWEVFSKSMNKIVVGDSYEFL